MRHAAHARGETELCDSVASLVHAASGFTSPERGEAIMRKWLAGVTVQGASEHRRMAIMADTILLAQDLVLSQASSSGTTAFDRLAKARRDDADARGTAALRAARFKLLRLDQPVSGDDVPARDLVSGETVRLLGAALPNLPGGVTLFGRMAAVDPNVWCRAGALTPLDDDALEVAVSHTARAAASSAGDFRWAEAVDGQVVRHGTLEVPGLNRPREDHDCLDDAEDSGLASLVESWVAIGEAAPDPDLVRQTRHYSDQVRMLDALSAHMMAHRSEKTAIARGFERLLLVMVETVARRERAGCGGLTLEIVRRALDARIAGGQLPDTARRVFTGLVQRVSGGGASGVDTAELVRVMTRIQGLRAKTMAQGCTEAEALAAAEKVAELLDRYGLSLGEVDFRAQACEGMAVEPGRRRTAPVDSCIPAVAAFFDCRVWREKADGIAFRYIFFGLRADVAAARYLHELVERAFETETAAFRAGDIYAAMEGERRSASNSFQIGLATGICTKLGALRSARATQGKSASGRDLVVLKAAMVDEEMAKLGLDLQARAGRPAGRRVLSDAFAAGHEVGQGFTWAEAIGQAA